MELQSMKNRNLYRGPSSSTEFNQRMNDLHVDLARIYDYVNENEEQLQKSTDVLLREYQFNQNLVEELRRELEEVKATQVSLLAGEQKGKMVRTFYNPNVVKDGNEKKQVFLDLDYGVITPNVSDISSKVSFVTDSGNVVVSSKMDMFVRESNNTQPYDEEAQDYVYYDVDSNGFEEMVDKQKSTYWLRSVRYPNGSGVQKVFGEVHIKLATDLLTNLYANALTIRPFPENSMTITDIHVKSLGNQWSRLENFPVLEDGETPVPIEQAKKMMFSFGRREIAEVKIRFEQPYWFEADNMREFTYGFQDIDLEYRGYTENECEFVTTYELTGTKRFAQIEKPVVYAADGTLLDVDGLVTHELYYDKGMASQFEFGSTILAPLQKVYVKTKVKREGERVPVLKRLELNYRFKDTNEV